MDFLRPNLPKISSAAETVAGIEDLLTEILLRLPVKPLLRFKSVSKQWLSLISNPHFSRRHIRRNCSPLAGIFLRRTCGLNKTEFDFAPVDDGNGKEKISGSAAAPFRFLDFVEDPSGIKILQSCNGLFLCSSFHRIGTTRKYYIYNPSTHQFSVLPPPNCVDSVAVFGVNLAYEPLKSPNYQVVLVRSTATSVYSNQIEIYSSETGAWRLYGDPFAAPFDIVFDNGVFWNGGIHWLSPTGASLYFDIDKGCLGTMPKLPVSGSWGKRMFRYFGESNGHLHLIELYGPSATKFKVYELERDYSRWFVKYYIDLHKLVTAFPEMVRDHLDPLDLNYYAFIILFLAREGTAEEGLLLLHIPGKVISYNVQNNTFEKLCDIESSNARTKTSLQFGWFDAYPYVESLACV